MDPGTHGRGQAAPAATTLPSSHSLHLKQRPSTPGLPWTLGWGGRCHGRQAGIGAVVEELTAAPHPGGSHPVCAGRSSPTPTPAGLTQSAQVGPPASGACLALSFSWGPLAPRRAWTQPPDHLNTTPKSGLEGENQQNVPSIRVENK